MTGDSVLLLALMVLPVVGALVLYPLRRNVQLAKQTAMGFALAEVVLVAVVWFAYSVPDAQAGVRFQLEFGIDWIPAFGTRFSLGIDRQGSQPRWHQRDGEQRLRRSPPLRPLRQRHYSLQSRRRALARNGLGRLACLDPPDRPAIASG